MARVVSIKINRVFKTSEEITRGLMFLKKLPENEGALFCMPETKIHRFWMKNTYVALDILFLDEDFRVVGIVKNAKPLDLHHNYVKIPSKYIVEIKAGYVKKVGALVGDYIKPVYKIHSRHLSKRQRKMKINTKTKKHI